MICEGISNIVKIINTHDPKKLAKDSVINYKLLKYILFNDFNFSRCTNDQGCIFDDVSVIMLDLIHCRQGSESLTTLINALSTIGNVINSEVYDFLRKVNNRTNHRSFFACEHITSIDPFTSIEKYSDDILKRLHRYGSISDHSYCAPLCNGKEESEFCFENVIDLRSDKYSVMLEEGEKTLYHIDIDLMKSPQRIVSECGEPEVLIKSINRKYRCYSELDIYLSDRIYSLRDAIECLALFHSQGMNQGLSTMMIPHLPYCDKYKELAEVLNEFVLKRSKEIIASGNVDKVIDRRNSVIFLLSIKERMVELFLRSSSVHCK